MEQRLGRADTVQAQALEKLGGEIARITERLAERIANAERRNALAIDDVGEQVSRVTERLNQRHERGSADLAERIRLSEERTARLLEEADPCPPDRRRAFIEDLPRVRAAGYAQNPSLTIEGVQNISAPIRDISGRVVAAATVTVTIPESELAEPSETR